MVTGTCLSLPPPRPGRVTLTATGMSSTNVASEPGPHRMLPRERRVVSQARLDDEIRQHEHPVRLAQAPESTAAGRSASRPRSVREPSEPSMYFP